MDVKDPLNTIISIVHILNLLKEDKEYEIEEIKERFKPHLDYITFKKYLKIISMVQRASPQVKLNESGFQIEYSKFQERLNEKERFCLYLHRKRAIDKDSAVKIPDDIDYPSIKNSIGYLYERIRDRFYLTNGTGMDTIKAINSTITEKIYDG